MALFWRTASNRWSEERRQIGVDFCSSNPFTEGLRPRKRVGSWRGELMTALMKKNDRVLHSSGRSFEGS